MRVLLIVALCLSLLTGCTIPRVSAEERLFLNLSLDFLGAYEIPQDTTVEGTPVRGLSGITYDRERDRFYALSDDRSQYAPARFYTLKLTIDPPMRIGEVTVERMTTLKNSAGEIYPPGSIDPEGITLSPRRSLFIASEGVPNEGISPFIDEFELETGQWQQRLPIPNRYNPALEGEPLQGVQSNRGFESLAVAASGFSANWQEPFRLFAATEASLEQDQPATAEQPNRVRLLHYLVGDLPILLSEHLYLVEPIPDGAEENGLVEIVTLNQAGHFLSMERSFGLSAGVNIQLFQLASGGATDISTIASLRGNVSGLEPVRKRLLLDFNTLEVPLDNFEGMALGPRLADGTQSVILVSDDNFNPLQKTLLLLFRLRSPA